MNYIGFALRIKKTTVSVLYLVTVATLQTLAQQPSRPVSPPVREGEVENQEITIEKSRRIDLPPANRLFNKIPSLKPSNEQRKMTYEFTDPFLAVSDPKLSPVVQPVELGKTDDQMQYSNYVKAGVGNYGSFYGEAFLSGQAQDNLMINGSLKHVSSSLGPIDGRKSAQSENKVNLNANYLTDLFKITGNIVFDRNVYYFYGYQPGIDLPRDLIRQRISAAQVRVGIENIDPKNNIDYSIKTGISSLRNLFQAAEFEWGTHFKGSVGISDHLVALISADAYLAQRTDGPKDNRNLFRLKPTFKYSTPLFTVTAGINAVNETESRQNIHRTRAFPVLDVDVVPTGNIHFFAGINGDIIRNTLRGFLSENRWLARRVVLANTEKTIDIYGGTKGELGIGLTYEGKISYALYRNFYGFNNASPDTSKFLIVYDSGRSSVVTVSGQLGYTFKELVRSMLRLDFYSYNMTEMEEAWHRPRFVGSWTNSITVNKKLFVTMDLYHFNGVKGKNPVSNVVFNLDPIWDLNLKADYFITKQIAAFVSLNNILGRNYQRYLYYPQQGLNFLGGISYSF